MEQHYRKQDAFLSHYAGYDYRRGLCYYVGKSYAGNDQFYGILL